MENKSFCKGNRCPPNAKIISNKEAVCIFNDYFANAHDPAKSSYFNIFIIVHLDHLFKITRNLKCFKFSNIYSINSKLDNECKEPFQCFINSLFLTSRYRPIGFDILSPEAYSKTNLLTPQGTIF